MKKFLLTAALVLALVTSLTAGTMAYYSTTIGTIGTTVTTKNFSITADKETGDFSSLIELAPGDKAVYVINVTNGSEVNADSIFTATLANLQAQFPNLSVKVERSIGTSGDSTNSKNAKLSETGSTGDAGTTTATSTVSGYMTIGSVDTYTVTVEWARGSKWEKSVTEGYVNKTFALNVNISGSQADEKVAYNELNGEIVD